MLDIITQFWRNIRSGFSKKKFGTSPTKFSYASKHHHFAQRRGNTLYSPIGQKSSPSLFFSRAYLPYIIIALVGIPLIFMIIWLYLNVFRDLPRISDIQSKSFSQASVITDRNGNELYKIFDENREYIEFDQMSPHFVNAIVAIEDQRFWTNRGIDIYGIARAAIKNVGGGSTITQQLIKNLLLSSEKKYSRKIKEILLALQINNFIAKDIASNHGDLAQKDLDRKVKEKILELYANYIFLGNNAYGLETAAKTYFGISAKDLSIVQASIIAGLPQAPSTYDPYTNRRAIAGELEISVVDEDQSIADETKGLLYDKVKQEIATAKFSSRSNETELLKFMSSLLDFTYELDGKQYQIKYYTGRKDLVLIRMYLDAYITEDQLKDALFEGFTLSFTRAKTNILAPHFVFWVMNQLEQQFDSEVLRKGGLVIKTTLDLDTQKLAEESVTENDPGVVGYGASNAAMVYIDSLQGDILAYVGSKDYFNQEIGGENDLVQSPRQVGSIMKPLLYAMGFMELPLAIDSPIYDLSMDIAGNTPENSDGKFSGLTTLKSALAASRNIPAIKLFLMIGGEIPFKNFLYQLGISSLNMEEEVYGYPLSIGAAEIPMLQMAQAYAHLSASGKPAKINPILEIKNANGDMLYQKKVEQEEQIIPTGVAYMVWNILSNPENLPAGRRKTFDFPAVKFASKSGTTNGIYGDKKLPRDGWFVAYTPSKVMMFWAGNNDGKPMKSSAYGGWVNAPTWRSFSNKLVKDKRISNESIVESDINKISLSKLSGLLAAATTPLEFITSTIAWSKQTPSGYDATSTLVELDAMCYGKVGPDTPADEVTQAYIINPITIMPDKRDQQAILTRWNSAGIEAFSTTKYFLSQDSIPDVCTGRALIIEQGELLLSVIQPTAGQNITRDFSVWHQSKSPFPITSVSFYLNDIEIKTYTYNKENIIDTSQISLPASLTPGEYTLKVVAKDAEGFADSKSIPVMLVDQDTNPPVLLRDKIVIEQQEETIPETDQRVINYKITLLFADSESAVKEGSIRQAGQQIATFQGPLVSFIVSSLQNISFVIVDTFDNKSSDTISFDDVLGQ